MNIEKQTALYSNLDRQYSEAMSGPYEDLSRNGTTCAAMAGGKITGYWRPVVIFEDSIDEIKRLWDTSRDILYEDYLIDGKLSAASKWLMSHGYIVEPNYVCIVDLREIRWGDIRKSYQNLINREIHDCRLADDIFNYKRLHSDLSGRSTRNHQSWKVQQKMIESMEGFLVEKDDGGVFVMHNDDWAYYASGKCRGNSHALMWKAILECRERGIRWLEMGEQTFFSNEKLINISNFKRGFGGVVVTRLILKVRDGQ